MSLYLSPRLTIGCAVRGSPDELADRLPPRPLVLRPGRPAGLDPAPLVRSRPPPVLGGLGDRARRDAGRRALRRPGDAAARLSDPGAPLHQSHPGGAARQPAAERPRAPDRSLAGARARGLWRRRVAALERPRRRRGAAARQSPIPGFPA